ncbi:MAG: hypothetical protein IIC06_07440, partial [Proteobacteria bacterium]|nr:hypothetical protein [Pseudomonadota bacterium]
MTRHRSLFSIARKNLLDLAAGPDPADPFRPLSTLDRPLRRRRRSPLGDPLKLAAPVGPAARNRPDDLGRVATALSETGFLKRPARPDRPRPSPPFGGPM